VTERRVEEALERLLTQRADDSDGYDDDAFFFSPPSSRGPYERRGYRVELMRWRCTAAITRFKPPLLRPSLTPRRWMMPSSYIICLRCFDTMPTGLSHDVAYHREGCPRNDFASPEWILARLLEREPKLLGLIRPAQLDTVTQEEGS
jgi:hypothetical protein